MPPERKFAQKSLKVGKKIGSVSLVFTEPGEKWRLPESNWGHTDFQSFI